MVHSLLQPPRLDPWASYYRTERDRTQLHRSLEVAHSTSGFIDLWFNSFCSIFHGSLGLTKDLNNKGKRTKKIQKKKFFHCTKKQSALEMLT